MNSLPRSLSVLFPELAVALADEELPACHASLPDLLECRRGDSLPVKPSLKAACDGPGEVDTDVRAASLVRETRRKVIGSRVPVDSIVSHQALCSTRIQPGPQNTGISCRASTLAPRAVSFIPLFCGGCVTHVHRGREHSTALGDDGRVPPKFTAVRNSRGPVACPPSPMSRVPDSTCT